MEHLPLAILQNLRHELHSRPETAQREAATARRIMDFLGQYRPHALHSGIGGHGLVAEYRGAQAGPTLLFRAELDGLPLNEQGTPAYRSRNPGAAHLCGHDGHMSIVAGLAPLLHARALRRGTVLLLFQPAEETGEGARAMLEDPRFAAFNPDAVYALHNLPGVERHSVVVREGCFAAASTGMIAEFGGRSSHAAHPESGISPFPVLAGCIPDLDALNRARADYRDFVLLTLIHAQVGSPAFGTAPGEAVLMATLRAFHDDDLAQLLRRAESIIREHARNGNVQCRIRRREAFAATWNAAGPLAALRRAARELDFPIEEAREPFRWSEDFGLFTRRFPGVLFGLGAGKEHARLHNPDYDFPDELIESGCALFWRIIHNTLGTTEL